MYETCKSCKAKSDKEKRNQRSFKACDDQQFGHHMILWNEADNYATNIDSTNDSSFKTYIELSSTLWGILSYLLFWTLLTCFTSLGAFRNESAQCNIAWRGNISSSVFTRKTKVSFHNAAHILKMLMNDKVCPKVANTDKCQECNDESEIVNKIRNTIAKELFAIRWNITMTLPLGVCPPRPPRA